ncbi:hypothetical protein Ae168Ps1_4889c [Pseudonocardia sp. Ae168_Ps1]|uniref:DUF7144 family membrane protein n=1 Tax=unclassified Pseudonocardia TaxID=2619320 RepID=UPI00094ACF75|nr:MULTISPECIES: hypothetical protein [unclassified Pseudonocardia]OLL76472.1 hypothetical protein Ae150APs1_4850c [Pseudonocardia sp. Ae150A_Ps1]OLL82483.1 hypothetical protein Ae168Ps1_4889c [Pseudonocardia sp. Ae168_Ps1]OLL83403.1 hypothetical protein Ae263Ps1_0458 [Pseudonocardia sp. Ae263_Ps1]OLL90558.1 hypothetical protein Ae356Ps1_0455c [Pseudonocardia sp. Ae356_Ps1]
MSLSEKAATTAGEATTRPHHREGWRTGLAFFAGIIMIVAGVFGAIQGLVGLFRNEVYVIGPEYVFSCDLTTWGWVHLIVGVVVALAGCAVLAGQTWGRVVGIVVVILSMVANFLFIPLYPLWSLLIITLDVFVIAALCTYTREPDTT